MAPDVPNSVVETSPTRKFGTTWNHPRSGLPPGTTPPTDWHIRLKQLWDQCRPSTRSVAETPGRHNARLSTQTMHNQYQGIYIACPSTVTRPHPEKAAECCKAQQGYGTTSFLDVLNLPHTGLPYIKCSPYAALTNVLTVQYPMEHRRGTSLITR